MSRVIAISVLTRHFADDCIGVCARCQRLVFFRPHVLPIAIDERICIDCYLCVASPDDQHILTRESLLELALYFLPTDRPQ